MHVLSSEYIDTTAGFRASNVTSLPVYVNDALDNHDESDVNDVQQTQRDDAKRGDGLKTRQQVEVNLPDMYLTVGRQIGATNVRS